MTAEAIVGDEISQENREWDDNGAEYRILEKQSILLENSIALSILHRMSFQSIGASKNMATLSVGDTCVSVRSYQEAGVIEMVCD